MRLDDVQIDTLLRWRASLDRIPAISALCWFLRWVLDEDERRALRWFSNHHAKCRDCGCDHVPREPGCTCHVEVGDSECVVHDEPDDDHGIFDELGD